MSKKNVHVTHLKEDKKCLLKKEGNIKASKVCDTKEEAVKISRLQAKNEESELVVLKKDNTIQNKDSEGNDPNSPKDKN